MISFAEPFSAPTNATLRTEIATLARGRTKAPLHVDTILGLYLRFERGEKPLGSAMSYLLFDLHRVVLYDDVLRLDAVGIDSVVRALVDAYPFQPLERLLEFIPGKPYRFVYQLDTLEILPLLWGSGQPGVVTIADLLTAEIVRTPAQLHPAIGPVRWARARSESVGAPMLPFQLHDCWTDASLRVSGARDLRSLVSPLGVVREERTASSFSLIPFAMTRVVLDRGKRMEFCYGKDLQSARASVAAICEATERFQVAFLPPDEPLVYGSYEEVRERAVDPRMLFFGDAISPSRRLRVYSDEVPMFWAWAGEPLGGKRVLVPAQEIWFGTSRLSDENRFISTTTSGCAVGNCFEEAALFALLEAIERDSFMTMWYLRRPCKRVKLSSIDHEPFQLLRRRWQAMFPDYGLFVFDLTADTAVPTVAAIAVRRQGHGRRTFHAAATRLSAEGACFAALKDLSGFVPSFTPEKRDRSLNLLHEPDRISSPADHFDLYALDEVFDRLSFLDFSTSEKLDVREINGRSVIPFQHRYNLRNVIESIASQMQSLGASVLLKDITHPWLEPNGLRCVRAITPGLFPIWFGADARRFAVTDRLRRLAIEWLGAPVTRAEDCNLSVHPFS